MRETSFHLTEDRIVFLKSRTKDEALEELVRAASKSIPGDRTEEILETVLDREKTVSSWIAPGIALPHVRLAGMDGFALSIGRSLEGVTYDSPDGSPVHLIFLILGDKDKPSEHLLHLAEIARLLKVPGIKSRIMEARSAAEVYGLLAPSGAGTAGFLGLSRRRISRVVLDHAEEVAMEVGARVLLVDVEALGDLSFGEDPAATIHVVPVVRNRSKYGEELNRFSEVIELPFPGLNRFGYVELTLLLALSRNILRIGDRVVGVTGSPGSGVLDTVSVIEMSSEFPALLSGQSGLQLGDIEPHILERVLQIALELAREGREGKPVGTLFVLGDYKQVMRRCQQMIMNPFRGYAEEERNILDPSLEETVKGFAMIDGAFILRGDGIIMSAGAYLNPENRAVEITAGLGARHTVGAAITSVTSAISVVVSQSTGNVTIFIKGKAAAVLQKTP